MYPYIEILLLILALPLCYFGLLKPRLQLGCTPRKLSRNYVLLLCALFITSTGLLFSLIVLAINVYFAHIYIDAITKFSSANKARADYSENRIKFLTEAENDGPTGRMIDGTPEWGWKSANIEQAFLFVIPEHDGFTEEYKKYMRRYIKEGRISSD
jgi:hypothetical protein